MSDNNSKDPLIYRPSVRGVSNCLYQGEILSDLVRVVIDVNTLGDTTPILIPIRHSYVLVVSQACDLDWDFKARSNSVSPDKLVPDIMFCEAKLATAIKTDPSRGINSNIWNGIKSNKDIRYQFLQKIEQTQDAFGEGVGELCLDFKRFFSVPTDEIYRRIDKGELRRRCILESPYVEHLSDRFAHFLSRVALPRDHESEKIL